MADIALILGVDGGNSKTELVVATLDGEPVAYLRGPGSNSHTEGPTRTAVFLSGPRCASGPHGPRGAGDVLPLRRRHPRRLRSARRGAGAGALGRARGRRQRHFAPGHLGEVAPAVVEAAAGGDAVAQRLVDRLAEQVVLMATRALADLGLAERPATVLLGGGMLRSGRGLLYEETLARLASRAPHAAAVPVTSAPVLGAALDALDAAGAPPSAAARLRAAFDVGLPVSSA